MKVIVAGYYKTGTKSMVAALLDLNYKVYDFMDHFEYHGDDWKKIFTKGGSVEDFQRMYKDVDAVTDQPAFMFWEEISKAFPDCKIILTTREEDSWYKSLKEQVAEYRNNRILQLTYIFSLTGWRFFRFFVQTCGLSTGYYISHPFKAGIDNEIVMRKLFRQHQTYCLQNAPKERLLVYHVSQGWEPLCKFLGKPIPNKPFPHANKGAIIFAELMRKHPCMLRMQRELMISLSLLLGLGVFGAYKFFKRGGGDYMMNLPCRMRNLFDVCVGTVTNI